MSELAENIIPQEVLLEETAKHLRASSTSLEAYEVAKQVSKDRAKKIMGLIAAASYTTPDGVTRLPKGIGIPLSGDKIRLPKGMWINVDGRVCITVNGEHFYLDEDELGDLTLRGYLINPWVEEQMDETHQSAGSVVRNLKLVGYVACIEGRNWREEKGTSERSKNKSVSYEMLYLTGRPFVDEEYDRAELHGQQQVGSSPALREYQATRTIPGERIQNFSSRVLFKEMELFQRGIDIFSL